MVRGATGSRQRLRPRPQPDSVVLAYAVGGIRAALIGPTDDHTGRSATSSTASLLGIPLCNQLLELGFCLGQIKPVYGLGETQVRVDTGNDDACIASAYEAS